MHVSKRGTEELFNIEFKARDRHMTASMDRRPKNTAVATVEAQYVYICIYGCKKKCNICFFLHRYMCETVFIEYW